MGERVFAVLGLFDSAQALVKAIPTVKAERIGRIEAYTPYPVHGIDEALGLRRSPLAGMVLVAGFLGAATALFFQWWMSAVDYPIPTGGKALFSWQAFVPIMFEVTVLLATFTAGLGMLVLLNRLPFFGHPMLSSEAIASVTRDKFALAVEADGPALDVEAVKAALRAAGAETLEVVQQPLSEAPPSYRFVVRTGLAILASCLVAGLGMYWAVKLFPVLPPMVHMQEQVKLVPQKSSAFLRDGHGMQRPVEGTVARGYMPYPFSDQEEAAVLVNPLPRTREILQQGRESWNHLCTVCHGALGNGLPTLTAAYGAKPANLQARSFREYPDGKIYHAIVAGKNAMPAYATELTEEERWAVVHYVRVLQRAQNARDEDLE